MKKEIPDSLKLVLYDEAGYQCAYCGHREGLDLTIHHIQPRKEKGLTDYSNLIVLCHNCQDRVHNTHSIKPKDLRRIKRYLVHRFFTQAGVNAAKVAYKHPEKLVVVAPHILQHLVDLKYFKHYEDVQSIEWEESGIEVVQEAVYQLTEKGIAITEQWLLRSDGV